MKLLSLASVFLFFLVSLAQACSVDCRLCHKLPQNEDHSPVEGCISCHLQIPKGKEHYSGVCGADCFDCHSVEKVLQNCRGRSDFEKCLGCHLKGQLFILP